MHTDSSSYETLADRRSFATEARLEALDTSDVRTVRMEVACARTVLDELAAVLDGVREGRTPREMLGPVADELARVALAMQKLARGE